ncbi:protein IQ-DOMAIN 13-like [Beta vulgaris subsp. vulgaris]|uniref:protein IQ-DOMAIN 13-like n=1 Tax=Beta vulgaris subsp. vulgaris TaxID=3555 RepID=UPI002037592E|nr:protein IQ-DOMAIN 13-like [Beta vulgaris subsp. vulgaris]
MKGHSVKRQTTNALKCMQMLVRVQNHIQSRRIQMLENQVLQRKAAYKNEQDLESSYSKWMSENQDQWDDSTLTKQEIEARMKRKYDAIVKRERAMAYAYSHQFSGRFFHLAEMGRLLQLIRPCHCHSGWGPLLAVSSPHQPSHYL